jgi:hypothetical protein
MAEAYSREAGSMPKVQISEMGRCEEAGAMKTKIEPVTTAEGAEMKRLYLAQDIPPIAGDDFAWAVNVVLARRENVSVEGFTGKEEV